ncbi:MAG: hypothetical protein NC548_33985 [Lachnospiraceae bacterium]|nr:hypothetical protein [Lachnospiraceae bacterium]
MLIKIKSDMLLIPKSNSESSIEEALALAEYKKLKTFNNKKFYEIYGSETQLFGYLMNIPIFCKERVTIR